MNLLIANTNSSTDSVGESQMIGFLRAVVGNFQYTQTLPSFECLPVDKLTALCMHISEKSLEEVWADEPDVWSNY